jgi:hypothetical protein
MMFVNCNPPYKVYTVYKDKNNMIKNTFSSPSISSHIPYKHDDDHKMMYIEIIDTGEFLPYNYDVMQALYDSNKLYNLINRNEAIK